MTHAVSIDTGFVALGYAIWETDGFMLDRRADDDAPEEPVEAGVITVPGRIKKSIDKLDRTSWIAVARWITDEFDERVLEDEDYEVTHIAMEWPEFRGGTAVGHAAATRDDLTKLALCAGVHSLQAWHYGAEAVLVPVSTWKGMLPKDVVERRIKRAIGDCDQYGQEFRSHAWDAVGIGLHCLGFHMDHPCFAKG